MTVRNAFATYLLVFFATLVTVVGGAWVYTAQYPLLFEESGYLVWRAKFDAVASCSTGSDVMLGDSRAQAAFVPADYSTRAFNLALGGSTPLEAYLTFKQLAPCLTPGQHVMLSIAPGDFSHLSVWLWENGVRYGFFGLSDLRELAAGAAAAGDQSFARVETRVGSGLSRDIMYGIHFPSLYTNNLLTARVMRRGEVNRELLARATERRGFMPFDTGNGVVTPVSETRQAHFRVLPVIDLFMRKLTGLAAAKGVVIDFIAAPVSELSLAAFTKSYQSEFADYMAQLAASSGGAMRIVSPLFYAFPDAAFSDEAHVSEAGARRFTRWLARCRDGMPGSDCTVPELRQASLGD